MNKKPIAIITGASTGIGKTLSIELSKKNFHVILIARSKKNLLKVQKEITNHKGCSTIVKADLTNPNEIDNIALKITNPEKIEVIVNNAGIGIFNKLQDISLEEWDNQINTNLRSAFLITKTFIPHLIHNKSGKILFINSVAGLSPYPYASAYVASKYGLRGFASSLREELREDNIKVISIHPGAVNTPLWDKSGTEFPKEEMLSTSDVSNMIIQTILSPNNLVCEEITLRRVKGDFN